MSRVFLARILGTIARSNFRPLLVTSLEEEQYIHSFTRFSIPPLKRNFIESHFPQKLTMITHPIPGAIILFDCKGFSLMHLTRIHLSIYKKLIHYVQDGINVKIVGVHLINVNWIIDKFMKLLKPFIRPEVFEFVRNESSADFLFLFTCLL